MADKSNEILATPALLNMLVIEGAVVTIDAMWCQRGIARTVRDKKADYILALKGNQGSLHADFELFVSEQKARDFADTMITRYVRAAWIALLSARPSSLETALVRLRLPIAISTAPLRPPVRSPRAARTPMLPKTQ